MGMVRYERGEIMSICAECGYKIEKDGWEIKKLEKRFLVMVPVYRGQICSRECAEKLMKRLESQSRNVPYSSKRG